MTVHGVSSSQRVSASASRVAPRCRRLLLPRVTSSRSVEPAVSGKAVPRYRRDRMEHPPAGVPSGQIALHNGHPRSGEDLQSRVLEVEGGGPLAGGSPRHRLASQGGFELACRSHSARRRSPAKRQPAQSQRGDATGPAMAHCRYRLGWEQAPAAETLPCQPHWPSDAGLSGWVQSRCPLPAV